MGKTELIGKGVLNWPKGERQTDRYGVVVLYSQPGPNSSDKAYFDAELVGSLGSLEAVVVETRRSYHIGDLFRGIYPKTPEVGDRFYLGYGRVFLEDGGIGLKPDDGRETDWLDPDALYRCHNQTVELYFTSIYG